ncbi:MAG: peptidoglycan DD-metalloendopeptidase family protein [Bacteroidetes bacterium]|jgi:murein hydrolase activator|nr:peptidoglycan DD-metalloendopeptidase family protein [Bacteroidota bacterium]
MTLQRFIFLVAFLITVTGASAQQSREELQKKEQELKKELSDLNRQLSETQKNKKLSLNELALIKRKVAKREELVRGINNQINELDNTIHLNEMDIYRLRKELDTLKLKYAKSIVFAYKSRGSYEYLNFLFSARNFNDAIKRMAYLKSYRQNRETQAIAIAQSRAMLTQKVDVLNSNKKERLVTLTAQSEQLKVLQEDKKAQDKVVAQLKGQESVIAKQIKDKEKQRVRMQQAVMAIIKREIDEAARKDKIAKQKAIDDAKKNAAAATAKNNTSDNSVKNNTAVNTAKNNEPIVLAKAGSRPYSPFESTEEGRETSMHFEQNKGRLPWPVDRGNVFIEFGVSTVPGTKLKQNSDGIHIALPEGSAVKSIADGEVSYVGEVNGDQVVMVRHGKYFTVYQQLSSASVSVGKEVKAGSMLGRSGKSIDGEGSIIFTINNERGVPLNPDQWLRPRR